MTIESTEPLDAPIEVGLGVGAALEFGRAAGTNDTGPVEIEDGVYRVLTPHGYRSQVVDFDDQYGEQPRFHTRTVTAERTESLIAYIERQIAHRAVDTDDITVYVDPDALSATVIFDDHGRRKNQATLRLVATPAWERWNGANRKMLPQTEFAELVEDGITEIASPSGTELLELAQTLQAKKDVSFRSSHRLQSGEIQVAYVEELDASAGRNGDLTIPTGIVLYFAPFDGADPRQLKARLRFRLNGQKLTLGVIIDDLEAFIQSAVEDEIAKVAASYPELLIVWGRP